MKVTKEQIQTWKEKYNSVYELADGDKKGYIFDPTSDLRIMKMVATAGKKGGTLTIVDSVLNNCWLGGDEILKNNDQYKIGLIDQIDELIEIPDYDIEFKKDHAEVTVCNKTVKLKFATRGDIKYAENRNRQGKPFDTAIHLIERLAMEGLNEVKKDNKAYMGLLLAIDEIKDKKFIAIKKL